jgi:hypothetical protein
MKEYHITFLTKGDNIAKGKKYKADDVIGALEQFKEEFPDAIFLYIASEEMFNYKY